MEVLTAVISVNAAKFMVETACTVFYCHLVLMKQSAYYYPHVQRLGPWIQVSECGILLIFHDRSICTSSVLTFKVSSHSVRTLQNCCCRPSSLHIYTLQASAHYKQVLFPQNRATLLLKNSHQQSSKHWRITKLLFQRMQKKRNYRMYMSDYVKETHSSILSGKPQQR